MQNFAGLGATVALPAPPAAWFDYAWAILMDGTLALLRADRDINAEYLSWLNQAKHGDGPPSPNLWTGRARLSVFDGVSEREAIELPMVFAPKVDRLADGSWLIVSARTRPGLGNAHLYSPQGQSLGSFSVGDGVQHVRCAPDGSIWVGYFDEGVFSDDVDGSPPVSAAGIARFGPNGRVLWKHNDACPELFVADCYAMTLSQDVVWSCNYADFPIVRTEGHTVCSWTNEVQGVRAFAVESDHVLLGGGYRDNAGRLALARIQNGCAELIGEATFEPLRTASLVQGLNDKLHVVAPGSWTTLSVTEALSVLHR